MKKIVVTLSLGLVILFQAPHAEALSCLPVDMYLESVVGDETTQVFIGTATEAKNHTQVVTVSEALQGWVGSKVWVEYPYSTDWQYFCSNGPATPGKTTVFITTFDQFGSQMVTQTLALDSDLSKDFVAMIEKKNLDAGINEVSAEGRAADVKQSIVDLLKVLVGKLQELKFWQNEISA